jgi:hypothetical protein
MGAQALSAFSLRRDEDPKRRFCALEYRAQGEWSTTSCKAPVVMIVVISQAGGLTFLIHPELRNMLEGEDLEYLDSLLWDLVERGRQYSDDLFKQLCSLGGVGPLATRQFGECTSDSGAFPSISEGFVEL